MSESDKPALEISEAARKLRDALVARALTIKPQEFTDGNGCYVGHTDHPAIIVHIADRLIQAALDAATAEGRRVERERIADYVESADFMGSYGLAQRIKNGEI